MVSHTQGLSAYRKDFLNAGVGFVRKLTLESEEKRNTCSTFEKFRANPGPRKHSVEKSFVADSSCYRMVPLAEPPVFEILS
eukprot:755714-Rhodomonas_salina.1